MWTCHLRVINQHIFTLPLIQVSWRGMSCQRRIFESRELPCSLLLKRFHIRGRSREHCFKCDQKVLSFWLLMKPKGVAGSVSMVKSIFLFCITITSLCALVAEIISEWSLVKLRHFLTVCLGERSEALQWRPIVCRNYSSKGLQPRWSSGTSSHRFQIF